MNRDTVANVLRAGFELRREQNIYVDVVKAIEARRPVGVRQGILARKSVSVCLGREGGHWVADITFVNHQTTRSADSPERLIRCPAERADAARAKVAAAGRCGQLFDVH